MKRNSIIILVAVLLTISSLIVSCISARITEKSGTDLWGENCQRCHNAPPRSAFTNAQWEVINTHMRLRAMLTETEYKKIQEFMQGD
jgi:hypothetical protein